METNTKMVKRRARSSLQTSARTSLNGGRDAVLASGTAAPVAAWPSAPQTASRVVMKATPATPDATIANR